MFPTPTLIGIAVGWGSNPPQIVLEQNTQIHTENSCSPIPTPHGSGMGTMYNFLLGIILIIHICTESHVFKEKKFC